MKYVLIFILSMISIGCGNKLSPLSPELQQKLTNQDGKIEELKTNQNGIVLDILKMRQESTINADKIENFQQSLLAIKGQTNTGIQILQGDGAMIMIFAIIVIVLILVYHYRTRAIKGEKTAEILAQQISAHNSKELENNIYMAALNTDIEDNVFHTISKYRKK